MSDLETSDSNLIHRASLLRGLQALHLARSAQGQLLKEEAYSAGYQEGFMEALNAVAFLVGVAKEFSSSVAQIEYVRLSSSTLVTIPTEKIERAT